jgi:Sec-independent protein translocase protein TatA
VLIHLLKKFGIVLVLAVGAIWGFIRKRIGLKKEQSEQQPTQSDQPEQSEQLAQSDQPEQSEQPEQDQANDNSKVKL